MPRAASWWQQVRLAANTVAPGGVCCKYCFPAAKWLKVFCYPLPTGSWTSSSASPSSPIYPVSQPLSLLPFETYRWCLSRREADQPEADCARGSWEVQGKASPTHFRHCPYLHELLVMGLWHMSHWTHTGGRALSAVIRDTTHWPFYTLWSFQATWGRTIHQGSPSWHRPWGVGWLGAGDGEWAETTTCWTCWSCSEGGGVA